MGSDELLLANLMMAKMDEPLAEVFSPVKFGNRAWAAFDPVDYVFAITQSAFTNPPGQSRKPLRSGADNRI